MTAWYDIEGLTLQDKEDKDGMIDSINLINDIIQIENEQYGIKPENIIIGGFSQGKTLLIKKGGAISYLVGLTQKEKLKGILCLSTYLPIRDYVKENVSKENISTPMLICHGKSDMVVNYGWGKLSYEGVKGIKGDENVKFIDYENMGHSSSNEELNDVFEWISKL
jgi:predicted esterase